MIVRKYRQSDTKELFKLFCDTIYTINSKDYTKEQLDAWAKKDRDLSLWEKSLSKNFTIVIEKNGTIIGFGNIDKTGYLDMLFIHKDFQRKELATLICDNLEKNFPLNKITVHSSITAKGFFEKRGYKVVKKQSVGRENISITNYILEKYFY